MLRTNLASAMAMAAFALAGCERLWQGNTRHDPQNCLIDPGICSAQQRCNFLTEICESLPRMPDLAMGAKTDSGVPQPAPPSQIFPHGPAMPAASLGTTSALMFAQPARFQLAALGPAQIFYTLDGSQPMVGTTATLSGKSVLELGTLSGTTTVRWVADYGPGFLNEPVNDFSFSLLTTVPDNYGTIPESVSFDNSGGPVVLVAPGADVNGRSVFRGWRSSPTGLCPSCTLQYVISAESKGVVACLNAVDQYGVYPGAINTLPFTFKAPLVPGRYRLYVGLTSQPSCDGTTVTGPDIGLVVVQ